MNESAKYVVSSTLKEGTWQNSKIVGPYSANAIRQVKADVGGGIYVSGSGRVIESQQRVVGACRQAAGRGRRDWHRQPHFASEPCLDDAQVVRGPGKRHSLGRGSWRCDECSQQYSVSRDSSARHAHL